jgi:phosphate transport system ATP-binding protein
MEGNGTMNAASAEQARGLAAGARVGVTVRAGAEAREETATKLAFDRFGLFYGAFQALKDISLEIPARRITAMIGPSGCGKSTLLRSINRMNELKSNVRTEGAIIFDGQNIADSAVDVVLLRRQVGMVFQKPNPFPLSIFDNVAFGLRRERLPKREVQERVERCLRQAGLWDEVKDKLRQSGLSLSGGQQQRLCIARAIAVEPEVLLMDEPASALDPIATNKIEDLMVDLRQRYTIVLVTHNMQQAARVGDFTAFMLADENRAGHVIEFGPTQQLFSMPKDKRTEDYITGRFG